MLLTAELTAPRWLFQHDRREEATQILRLLHTHHGVVDEDALAATISEISEVIALESKQKGWKELLLKEDNVGSRRRVLLACLLNACQAWSGSTPVSYYTTVMFVSSNPSPFNFPANGIFLGARV